MECTCVLGASQPGKSHPMPFYSITSTDQPDMGGHAASTHVNSSGSCQLSFCRKVTADQFVARPS